MPAPEYIRSFVDQQPIATLATTSKDGVPNAAPMYWKVWYSDDTILILDNYMNATKRNVLSTKNASLSVWNAETGEAYQLKGKADYFTEGIHMEAAIAHMNRQKPGSRPRGVVVLHVSEIYNQKAGDQAGSLLTLD